MRSILTALLALSLFARADLVMAQPAPAAEKQAPTDLKLPSLFTDHMVLQRNTRAKVWGWSAPNDQVTVAIANQQKQTQADARGEWMLQLDPLPAGGPHDLTISTKDKTLTIKDVLIGEVWICSGQSNMEWPLRASTNGPEEAAKANNPNIRLFTVPKRMADEPQDDVKSSWKTLDPKSAESFSAVAYHFGQEIHKSLNVPVGLIHTSWGGTAIELWQSRESLEASPEYSGMLKWHRDAAASFPERKKKRDEEIAAARAAGKTGRDVPQPIRDPMRPSSLWNGMVNPLVPYSAAGVIWYQGESNANDAKLYRKAMPDMIRQWRKDFGQDMPFMITQLANFMKREDQPTDSAWAELREAQLLATQTPKTGMAVAIDIGETSDIHPRNKQDVGRRLALAALAIAYNQPVVYSGPVYESMAVEGDKIRIKFKHLGAGLTAKNGDTLKGFAIAAEDRKFVWADAKIDGDTVVVWSDKVTKPVAVRYGWANNPDVNLYNKEGLPASPFRTDDWERPKPAR